MGGVDPYRPKHAFSPVGGGIRTLVERRAVKKAAVALAAKTVRVVSAMMARQEVYQAAVTA